MPMGGFNNQGSIDDLMNIKEQLKVDIEELKVTKSKLQNVIAGEIELRREALEKEYVIRNGALAREKADFLESKAKLEEQLSKEKDQARKDTINSTTAVDMAHSELKKIQAQIQEIKDKNDARDSELSERERALTLFKDELQLKASEVKQGFDVLADNLRKMGAQESILRDKAIAIDKDKTLAAGDFARSNALLNDVQKLRNEIEEKQLKVSAMLGENLALKEINAKSLADIVEKIKENEALLAKSSDTIAAQQVEAKRQALIQEQLAEKERTVDEKQRALVLENRKLDEKIATLKKLRAEE